MELDKIGYEVVCDETNNTPETIAKRELHVDVTLTGLVATKLKQSVIPAGPYCYTYIDSYRYVCPYYSIRKGYHSQEDGYCAYLGKGDYEINREAYWTSGDDPGGEPQTAVEIGIPMSLLWDMCKECGINTEWEEKDEIS
jgi:hypothetical protein